MVKVAHLSDTVYLITKRIELAATLQSIIEKGSADCTIGGTYQKHKMPEDLVERFNTVMCEHVQRQIDSIDVGLAELGLTIDSEGSVDVAQEQQVLDDLL